MRRSRTRVLPLVTALAAAILVAGCGDASSHSAGTAVSVSPRSQDLLNGTVTLAAARPLSAAEQRQVKSVLKARLDALQIDSVVTMVGDRTVRLQVSATTLGVVRQLGAQGRFEIRPVETMGPKGQAPAAPLGAVPVPVTRSAGHCAVTSPGDTQGWLVACDGAQQDSFILWPAELNNADVASATELPSQDPQSKGQWFVNVRFTTAGQRRFFDVTQRVLGMQVALVVDGVVESAPVIQTAIDGDAQITAAMDKPQALLLATLVGNGALPVPMRAQSALSG
jgi:preprotein translocase subunit SecD